MEFLSPKQKRRRTHQLYVGYGLLVLLTLLLTFILVSTARGYILFSKDGDLKQNGLLFLGSNPSGADVYINGKKEQDATESRLSLPDGVYAVELKKEGFRTWSKSIVLQGGQVSFISYPRLTPVEPQKDIVGTYVDYTPLSVQSRDRRWVISSVKESALSWQIYDLEKITEPPKQFTVSPSLFDEAMTPVIGSEVLEWAGDNSHILIRFSHQDGRKSLVVCSKNDAASCVHLSAVFGVTTEAKFGFWDGKWDQYYYVDTAGTMRKADLKTNSISSQPLAVGVTGSIYILSGARFLYASQTTPTETTVRLVDGVDIYTIGVYATQSANVALASAGLNRNEYVVVGGIELPKTYVYKNPQSFDQTRTQKLAPTVLLPIRSEVVSFSHGNRFILASDKQNAYVYDIEKKEQVKSIFTQEDLTLVSSGWIDSARVYNRYENGDLYIQDYDGSNRVRLLQSTKTNPLVTEDGSVMYELTSSKSVTNTLGIQLDSPAK